MFEDKPVAGAVDEFIVKLNKVVLDSRPVVTVFEAETRRSVLELDKADRLGKEL